MYNHQDAGKMRQKFWTVFGQYMRPVPASNGEPVNWVNYKTGVKQIFFRLDATAQFASIAIEFRQQDGAMRHHYFTKFLALKTFFEEEMKDWKWNEDVLDIHVNEYSNIGTRLNNVNIYKESDWPQIIDFFKQNMLSLDRFWNAFKDVIE